MGARVLLGSMEAFPQRHCFRARCEGAHTHTPVYETHGFTTALHVLELKNVPQAMTYALQDGTVLRIDDVSEVHTLCMCIDAVSQRFPLIFHLDPPCIHPTTHTIG